MNNWFKVQIRSFLGIAVILLEIFFCSGGKVTSLNRCSCGNLNLLSFIIGFLLHLLNTCNLFVLEPCLIPNSNAPGNSIICFIGVSVVYSRNNLCLNIDQGSILEFWEFLFDKLIDFLIGISDILCCPSTNDLTFITIFFHLRRLFLKVQWCAS